MQTLWRCYCGESGFDWTTYLSMVEFYYNCSINEATTQSPFEVMYAYQPSILADRLFQLAGGATDAANRLTLIADIRDGVNQFLKLTKEKMAAK